MTYTVRENRMKRNMTQGELAEKSGLSRATINYLERHPEKNASTRTLSKVASALDVPIEALFYANSVNSVEQEAQK